MEPETAWEAVLIDEFDAPPTALRHTETPMRASARRKGPVADDVHARRCGDATDAQSVGLLTPKDKDPRTLRAYPSFDALVAPTSVPDATTANAYPRFAGEPLKPSSTPVIAAHGTEQEAVRLQDGDHEECRLNNDDNDVAAAAHSAVAQSCRLAPTAQPASVPTDEEIELQRRQLETEVRRFEQQASYMALALAGETPHQLEMRRLRDEERKEREDKRLAAVETRIEHMVERELQREARHEQRRQRLTERTHRASVSPSPERTASIEDEVAREVETDTRL